MLSESIKYLKGIGEKTAKLFEKLGIFTIEDLLRYYPKKYTDLREFTGISTALEGKTVTIKVRVVDKANLFRTSKGLSILTLPCECDGIPVDLIWYRREYWINKFKIGERYEVSGKLSRKGKRFQISSPLIELKGRDKIGNIVAVYSLTKGLSNDKVRATVKSALPYAVEFQEILSDDLRGRTTLMGVSEAIREIHNPKSPESLKRAILRLKTEELLIYSLALSFIKRETIEKKGRKLDDFGETKKLIKKLPFELTKSQERAIEDIISDLKSERRMNRLLQGDVGSGKTIVAFLSMIYAFFSKSQSALLVPTGVLATQHYENFLKLIEALGVDIKVALLQGGTREREKREIKEKLKTGEISAVIGTHAILEEDCEFFDLGLVVTDEQHRFGVAQRAKLEKKTETPNVLVMSATPIPRTLTLTIFGDLDLSIIDELPKGRKPIRTTLIPFSMEERMFDFIKKELDRGNKAYMVTPMIEENEDYPVKSVEELYREISEKFQGYNVALLHGKMKDEEKDEILFDFLDGDIDILCSTTVVEVGVDVKKATVMAIYNAERFGLSGLHQLRGRVGRGEDASYCFLLSDMPVERLKIMENTNNGFEIAEKDLSLRGSGDVLGKAQSGLPEFMIADMYKDFYLFQRVMALGESILEDDPNLSEDKNKKLRETVEKFLEKLNKGEISYS